MIVSPELLLERARAAHERGRYAEALTQYEAVLAASPQQAEAWQGKAAALERLGRPADAIPAYDEARRSDPGRFGESALFAVGNCHASLGDKAAALVCYDRVIAMNPAGGSAWHNRGMALLEVGRETEAAESFARAASLTDALQSHVWQAHCLFLIGRTADAEQIASRVGERPDRSAVSTAWLQVATHEYHRNHHAAVLAAADRALAVDSAMGHGWLFRGMSLAKLGQRDEALAAFDRAIAARPTALAGWANKAALLQALGRTRAAVHASEKVIGLTPQSTEDHLFRVRALQVLGRPEEALRALAVVKKKLPDAVTRWQEEGLALEALGRREEAVACFQQYVARVPGQGAIYLRLARGLFDLGRIEEGVAACDRAIELLPKAPAAWLYKGAALGNAGQKEEAVACFSRAIAENPRDADSYLMRGVYLSQLGQNDVALQDYEQALRRSPEEVTLLRVRAQLLATLGREREAQAWTLAANGLDALLGGTEREGAETALRAALAAEPSVWVAARALASVAHRAGRLDEAIAFYDQALAVRRDDPRLWSDCGVAWAQQGQRQRAAKCFHQALAVDPAFAPALRNAAIDAFERDDFAGALELYDCALAIDDEASAAWYGRGVALARLARVDEAITAFERCVAIDPTDTDGWRDLGTCLVGRQNLKRGIAAWKKVLELDPKADLGESVRQLEASAAAQPDLGEWYAAQGNGALARGQHALAAHYFDQSLAIEPNVSSVVNDRGLCAEVLETPLAAIGYFDRAIELDPANLHAWYNKGVSLQRLRRHADAITCFETVVERHPEDGPPDANLMHAWHNLASSQYQLGRSEAAVDCFDEVLKRARDEPERWPEEARRARQLKQSILQTTQ